MIYLDNCASTRPYDEVAKKVYDVMTNEYANSAALHRFGFNSEKIVRESAQIIADSLDVKPEEIIFTSGASESNNMAIIGSTKVHKRQGNHIITTNIEHPAVRKVCTMLEDEGFEVTYLDVDENGMISIDEFKKALKETTIFVSMMAINSEVGTRLPINEVGRIIKEYNKNIIFHVDGTQEYMKYKVNIKNIDLYSVSAHKFHGPKGIGFLYKRMGINIPPYILGGSHQQGMRAGTINVPAIAGMAEAVKIRKPKLEEIRGKVKEIKNYFIDQLKGIQGAHINTKGNNISDYVCSVRFDEIRSEVMLHALEDEGIYVSAGSACSAHSKNISSVLVNIGLNKNQAESTIRFSFSEFNTKDEIDIVIKNLKNLVPMLRKFVRK